MRDIHASNGRAVLDKPARRRNAAKALAIALQTRYKRFLESSGDENATVVTSADLAQCMYENVEFVIWALKSIGGMHPPPPEELRRISPPQPLPANDDSRFRKPPEVVLEDDQENGSSGLPGAGGEPVELPCTCPPLEHGILFRERHMTSCPKYVP